MTSMPAGETSQSSAERSLRLDDIFSDVQDELDIVEQIIRDKVQSKLELVESSSRYIYRGGGKRVPWGGRRSCNCEAPGCCGAI